MRWWKPIDWNFYIGTGVWLYDELVRREVFGSIADLAPGYKVTYTLDPLDFHAELVTPTWAKLA